MSSGNNLTQPEASGWWCDRSHGAVREDPEGVAGP